MNERGFVLTLVVVFTMLVTLVAASTAILTRTNTQIVINGRTSVQSLYLAEAGVAEAVLRLEMPDPTQVTVNGRTFNAAIVPDAADANWNGQILLGSFAPGKFGSTFTTPTIQATASQLGYSTTSAGTDSLTIQWVKDGLGNIRKIQNRNVAEVVATGVTGPSKRKVTLQVLQPNNIGFIALETGSSGCPTADMGSAVVTLYASLWVNSPCAVALSTRNSTVMNVTGSINVVGGWNGSGVVSPTPQTGQAPVADPLASLPVPVFNDHPTRNGTPGNPTTLSITSNTTLQPGVYYGGISIGGSAVVTFNPGLYIMAGGGFEMNGSSTAWPTMNAGGGVTIYNSQSQAGGSKAAAQFGELKFVGQGNLNIAAPTSGPWKGVLLFNDRANPQDVKLAGAGVSTFQFDGAIYAANSLVRVSGNPKNVRGDIVARRFDFVASMTAQEPTTTLRSVKYDRIAWQDY